jgi:pimeloyl-ACP methyl ester carboxylesterase/tellurite resistance protein
MQSYPTTPYPAVLNWYQAAFDYTLDRWQRSILFWDIMRRRGNAYLDHLKAGQPPVLVFDYETIMDGRDMDPPVNYALVKITERRKIETDRRRGERESAGRRLIESGDGRSETDPTARPLVVIDPRAGHGPGIGGSKLNSQIGIALTYGYPVYFVMFSPEPVPGQTIAAVQQAEIHFLEEVARRHPKAPKPAVIGNCQAGWAAALIGADRPDLVGPMVLNGSPLSYWGGVEGANPMRYKGGLTGGAWSASLWSDLGNGQFDGAHLVAAFEDLNPANTYWTKSYNLFRGVDTEARRFLDFDTWWGGFFKLDGREIQFITSSLFVGNELEKGLVELQKGRPINLKNFKDPIFVFASSGDNITPPPQALNWIVKVYGSLDEIKRQGQTIVYMVHENIGHLGIFVSGRILNKEHRQIIGCLEMIEYLMPGLYEMVITGDATHPDLEDYTVQFEPRDMDDILAMDDGLQDEKAFVPVAAVSAANDTLYRQWAQPWIRAMVTPWSAEALRQLHPLRVQRYAFSDLNPWLWPLAFWSDQTSRNRKPVTDDNPFVKAETWFSDTMTAALNCYRDIRDKSQEWLFKSIYGTPWMNFWWGSSEEPAAGARDETEGSSVDQRRGRELAFAQQHARRGGFAEAVVRIIIAVAGANRVLDKREYLAAETIIRRHRKFQHRTPAEVKQMVHTQARILAADPKLALETLAQILPGPMEREEAFEIALKIAVADLNVGVDERSLLTRIRVILSLHHSDLHT